MAGIGISSRFTTETFTIARGETSQMEVPEIQDKRKTEIKRKFNFSSSRTTWDVEIPLLCRSSLSPLLLLEVTTAYCPRLPGVSIKLSNKNNKINLNNLWTTCLELPGYFFLSLSAYAP